MATRRLSAVEFNEPRCCGSCRPRHRNVDHRVNRGGLHRRDAPGAETGAAAEPEPEPEPHRPSPLDVATALRTRPRTRAPRATIVLLDRHSGEEHKIIFNRAKKRQRDPELEPKPESEIPLIDWTCGLCGVATMRPERGPEKWADGTRRPPRAEHNDWSMCGDCAATWAAHRHDTRAAAVVLMGEILAEELDPHDPAARLAVNLPLARSVPELGQLAPQPYAPRVIGADSIPLEQRGGGPTMPKGRGAGSRWTHVSDEDRDRLRDQLARERRKRRHRDGPCGCCSALRAVRWSSPHQVSTDAVRPAGCSAATARRCSTGPGP